MAKVYFVLEAGAGELARREVKQIRIDGGYEPGDYTEQLIDWLREDHIVLTEGDTIRIISEEN